MPHETLKHFLDLQDEELVRLYLATQNDKYFSELYRRYSGKIYAKCLSFLKDEQEAVDGVHDIFMKILVSLSRFEEKSKFSTWLFSISYNYCIDELRKSKKIQQSPIDEIQDEKDWEDDDSQDWIEQFSTAEINTILDMLHPQDKAVLLMKYLDGFSIKEIAEVMNKSESAIKMKIKRSKERFRNFYYKKIESDGK